VYVGSEKKAMLRTPDDPNNCLALRLAMEASRNDPTGMTVALHVG
jgi:hypothetical protein